MSSFSQKFGIASLVIFGASAYATYYYNESARFKEEVFGSQKNKKQYLFRIHQLKAYTYDKFLEPYEKYSKLDSYRKILVSHASGDILETGVGTSRNLDYYPYDSQVTGVDWSPNVLEVAMMKPTTTQISYAIEDVEQLTFKDDSFDTVVDTFGLEYYLYPDRVLKEMKRVCKKDGKILILTTGSSYYDYLNLYLEFKFPHYMSKYGYFPNRKWADYIKEEDFTIEKQERKMNGTIYLYILKNDKK